MKRIALFTGAGASKPFEIPLTAELLPIIWTRLQGDSLFTASKNDLRDQDIMRTFLKAVVPGIVEIQPEHMPLITELLSLIDYSTLTQSALSTEYPRRRLSAIRNMLERGIYKALDWDIAYEAEPRALSAIVQWLGDLFDTPDHTIGLISTNYDPLFEMRLFDRLGKGRVVTGMDFGFTWLDVDGNLQPRPERPRMAAYKLHGGLNWLKCPLCERVYVNIVDAVIHEAFRGDDADDDFNTCHCGYRPLDAVMVAPSTIRDIRDSTLLEIWRHALEFLRTADEWVIVGYSFPPEDVAIRAMFLRAYLGAPKKPNITIVQRGRDSRTLARYRAMFPQARYSDTGVEGFANALPNYESYCARAARLGDLMDEVLAHQ